MVFPIKSETASAAIVRYVLFSESPTPKVPLRKISSAMLSWIVTISPKKLAVTTPPERVSVLDGSITPLPGTIEKLLKLKALLFTPSLKEKINCEVFKLRIKDCSTGGVLSSTTVSACIASTGCTSRLPERSAIVPVPGSRNVSKVLEPKPKALMEAKSSRLSSTVVVSTLVMLVVSVYTTVGETAAF